jgi:hypothetical protein
MTDIWNSSNKYVNINSGALFFNRKTKLQRYSDVLKTACFVAAENEDAVNPIVQACRRIKFQGR